jgi:hypothetical protein
MKTRSAPQEMRNDEETGPRDVDVSWAYSIFFFIVTFFFYLLFLATDYHNEDTNGAARDAE